MVGGGLVIVAPVVLQVDGGELGLDKVHALLQGERVVAARVQDAHAHLQPREQLFVVVDEVHGEEHGLQTLDALLLLDLAAVHAVRALLVHGEQPAEDDVPLGVHLLAAGLTLDRLHHGPDHQGHHQGQSKHSLHQRHLSVSSDWPAPPVWREFVFHTRIESQQIKCVFLSFLLGVILSELWTVTDRERVCRTVSTLAC